MNQQSNIKQQINTLKSIISDKKQSPIICNKVTLDWKQAEIALCEQITNYGIVIKLIELQKECFKHKIGCFYSFFIMQKLLKDSPVEDIISQQTNTILQQKSKYHQIKSFIKMREHLLSKINQFTGSNIKSLFEDIDDIRFLNFQIIFLIDKWKNQWRVSHQIEPVFYQGNINYLLKINNDNVDMINLANFKKTKFISPPNPFFISEDGNLQGMSSKQKEDINICMEIINKQRGIDLRMSVNGGIFVKKNQKGVKSKEKTLIKRQASFRKEKVQNSFVKQAKNQILSVKQEEIRKIYKINKSLQTTKTKASQQKIINIKIRKESNQKKQTQKLQMYSKNVEKNYSSQKSIKQAATKQVNIIQAKLNINKNVKPAPQMSKTSNSNIRSQIDKVVKELSQTQSPIKWKQVKQMKPKIKLIQQKQSTVQVPIKNVNISFNATASRSLNRKNSTFYKKIQPILQQTEDNQIVPTTQNIKKRSLSQSNFYTLKQKKQQVQKDNKSIDLKQVQSSFISKKKQPQSQIRTLNSQIKNLTIINIYKSKKNIKKPKNSSVDQIKMQQSIAKNNAMSFITEIDNNQSKIDTSKFDLNLHRIKKENQNEISKISQQLSKKSIKIRKNQQILQAKQRKRLQAQKQLQLKSMLISQLQQKIKSFQQKKKTTNKKEETLKNHTKQYERTRKMRQIQSRILKDKIKSEQQKFIAHREMQLKIKEQSIKKEFKNNIKSLEIQTLKKKKEYQKLMLEEEKRYKQTEKLIIKQKNRYKQIQNQLQQKRLKQTLLKKIMQEKEEAINKQYQSEKDLEKALQNQIKMRQKMELQSLELIQVDKKKMEQFYRQMIEKNKLIEQQNQRKLKQLNKIDQQRNKQLQKMKQLQQNYSTLIKNQQRQQNIQKEQNQTVKDHEDMESLKLKLKQELLQEIVKKQQEEEQYEKQEQQRRQRRLKKIQQEIANAMKAEEDLIQKQNQQFLKKLEHMKQATIIPSTHQPHNQQQNTQQKQQISLIENNEKISQSQTINAFQLKPTDSIMNDIDLQIKNIEEIKQKNESSFQKVEVSKQEQPKQQNKQAQKPTQELKNDSVEAQEKSKVKDNLQKEKINEGENVLQKYKKIKEFTKKTKQLTVEDKNIGTFIDSFILQLEKPVRQMLPLNKYDLEKIFNTKKIDIYQYNSVGWMDEKDRYNLIGGLQCIENIVRKYGTVEIHQLFIFDKTNPYQKQSLAKKMKTYQSIGYVYQKKLQEPNKYSIRFIIKVPKEIGGEVKKNRPQIYSKISIQNMTQAKKSQQYLNQFSISYLYSRIIKQNLQKSKLQSYIDHPEHFNKTIQKQIKQGQLRHVYKNLKIEEINDNIISTQILLPFKYFRNHQRGFYMAKFNAFQLQDSHFYVTYIQQGLAIVLQQTKAKNIPLDYILLNTIETINSSTKMRETDVCLPIWSYNTTTSIEQCGLNLIYRQKLITEFSLGSVINTFLLKHQYVEMRAPFIISYCEVDKQKKLIRPLIGHRVTQKNIVFNNLK